jgi:ABC-2 type transport system permease protein
MVFYVVDNLGSLSFFLFLLFISIPSSALISEEKNNGYILLCSLPLKRTSFLMSKFFASWLVIFFLIACYSGIFMLSAIYFHNFSGTFVVPFLINSIYIGLLVVSLNIGLFFPIIIAFRNPDMLPVGIIIVNIIAGVIAYYLKLNIYIVHTSDYIRHSLGEMSFVMLFLALMLLFNYISYRATVFVFSKREF